MADTTDTTVEGGATATNTTVYSAASSAKADREIYASQIEPHNIELRTAIADSHALLKSMKMDTARVIRNYQERWNSALEEGESRCNDFDKEMVYPHTVGFNGQRLTDEFNLILGPKWFSEYGDISNVSAALAHPLFDELQSSGMTPLRRTEVKASFEDIIKKLFPLNDHDLVNTLMRMNEFLFTDPLAVLKAEFAASQSKLAKLESLLLQTIEERDHAIRKEDMVLAEEKSAEAMSVFIQIIHIIQDRSARAQMGGTDSAAYLENLQAFLSGSALESARKGADVIKGDVTTDIKRLTEEAQAFAEKHNRARQEYEARKKDFSCHLDKNSREQEKQWELIVDALEKLDKLCSEREEVITAHTQDTEKEQLRIRTFSEFSEALTERKATLQKLMKNVNSALEFLDLSDDFVKKAQVEIQDSDVEGKLSKLQVDECMRYYDCYVRYVKFSGEIVFRKEQRLENIRRLVRNTEFQIRHAMDSLDTDLPIYKEQLKKQTLTEQTLVDALAELKFAMQEQQEAWLPTEDRLDSMFDIDVDPPSLILQELQRDLLQQHVHAVDELTNTEQKMLDSEKSSVRKMATAVDATKTTFEERKSTRRQARLANSPQKDSSSVASPSHE